MFLDTFAVELLNKGVPIDRVSLLLDHSSVKVTEKHEKHYASFVKERQQQLENYARVAWDDTVAGGQPEPGAKSRPKAFLAQSKQGEQFGKLRCINSGVSSLSFELTVGLSRVDL